MTTMIKGGPAAGAEKIMMETTTTTKDDGKILCEQCRREYVCSMCTGHEQGGGGGALSGNEALFGIHMNTAKLQKPHCFVPLSTGHVAFR